MSSLLSFYKVNTRSHGNDHTLNSHIKCYLVCFRYLRYYYTSIWLFYITRYMVGLECHVTWRIKCGDTRKINILPHLLENLGIFHSQRYEKTNMRIRWWKIWFMFIIQFSDYIISFHTRMIREMTKANR